MVKARATRQVKPLLAKPAAASPSRLASEKNEVAVQVLAGLGIVNNAAAKAKMVAWFDQEGGHWNNSARYNPLNTTLEMPGAGNTGSQGNIKVYTSWQQGIDATVKTLQMPAYKSIIASLKAGSGTAFENAVNSSPWGTHFPGGVVGSAPAKETAAQHEQTIKELTLQPGAPGSLAGGAVEAAKAAVSTRIFKDLTKFALYAALLIIGAVLVIYGFMVAVRPPDKALSLPRFPMPVPVPA